MNSYEINEFLFYAALVGLETVVFGVGLLLIIWFFWRY